MLALGRANAWLLEQGLDPLEFSLSELVLNEDHTPNDL